MSESFVVFLSSEETRDDDSQANFTVHLAQPLHLREAWEVALVDFCMSTTSHNNAVVSIICDAVDSSICNSQQLPLLRKLATRSFTFGDSLYIPVRQRDITSINIRLLSGSGQPLTFRDPDQPTLLTLRFRKVKH